MDFTQAKIEAAEMGLSFKSDDRRQELTFFNGQGLSFFNGSWAKVKKDGSTDWTKTFESPIIALQQFYKLGHIDMITPLGR